MRDSFVSSLLFFRTHRGATFLLVVSLSLLFFSCLTLHSLSSKGLFQLQTNDHEYNRLYTLKLQPTDKAKTDGLIAMLNKSGLPIQNIDLLGEGKMINAAQSEMTLPLVALVNPINTPALIFRGSDRCDSKQVLLNSWDISIIYGPSETSFYKPSDYGTLYFKNGQSREIAGVVFYQSDLDLFGIIVDSDDFYSLTDRCTSVQVLFSRVLTSEEEEAWIRAAQHEVTITGITYPSDKLKPIQAESATLQRMSWVIIIICLFCAMRIMMYLFFLRKQEFAILRMLGATRTHMITHVFAMQIEISGIGVLIGAGGYRLLFLIKGVEEYLYALSFRMIFDDAVFFLISTLLVGIISIAYNHQIRITEMYEGV